MGAILGISDDEILAVILPVVVYWVYAWMYMALEPYCAKYRLHSKKEEDEMNLVSRGTVIKGVIFQQFLQAMTALLWFLTRGPRNGDGASVEQPTSVYDISKQLLIAMVVKDTHLYFVHRFILHNKYLYKYLHADHHRLVVPYVYGASYVHPIEGFISDISGASLGYIVSGMSARTSIFFFCFISMKNVDDHCGIMHPWNPFHLIFRNNSAYHDLHHQLYGGKYNYDQPFFVFWDKILGTHMPFSIVERAEGGLKIQLEKDYKED
ncbi:hypothetical protein DITRI_Ditri17bG0126600 [Diplodiscus trichospermus]